MSSELTSTSSCATECCGCSSTTTRPAAPPPAEGARTVIAIEKMDCPTEEALIRKRLDTVRGVGGLHFDLIGRKLVVVHEPPALPSFLSALEQLGMPGRVEGQRNERSTIRIEKMDCPTEEALIRKRLGSMPGVENLQFDLVNRRLSLGHPVGQLPDVLASLRDVGMEGQPELPHVEAAAQPLANPRKHWAAENWKLLLGGAFAIAAEVVALAIGDLSLPAALLALAAIALSGLGTYRKGFIALRHRSLNINALMSIAVTGAVLIGQWPEAAMVMFLFGVAEAIEARSLARAKRAVESLVSMAPQTATVRTGSIWETVPVASVSVGAVVRVGPAERIPLDGVMTAGSTAVDQASITGESIPVDKTVGDQLFAGTVNQNGEIEFRTTALASQSPLSRIVHTVQEAQASRPRCRTWSTSSRPTTRLPSWPSPSPSPSSRRCSWEATG